MRSFRCEVCSTYGETSSVGRTPTTCSDECRRVYKVGRQRARRDARRRAQEDAEHREWLTRALNVGDVAVLEVLEDSGR